MKMVALATGGIIALVLGASHHGFAAAAQGPPGDDIVAAHRAVLTQYCVPCHNERNRANVGRLPLDSAELTSIGEHAEQWEKVVVTLRAGVMPPARRPRPNPTTRAALVGFLESELMAGHCAVATYFVSYACYT